MKSKILFIGEQVVSAHTLIPQYTSISLSRHFFLPDPKKEAKYKEFLTVATGFFLSFENTEAGKKKIHSAQVFQEWNVETPQFLNSSHRLLKCLVPHLVKEHNVNWTSLAWVLAQFLLV